MLREGVFDPRERTQQAAFLCIGSRGEGRLLENVREARLRHRHGLNVEARPNARDHIPLLRRGADDLHPLEAARASLERRSRPRSFYRIYANAAGCAFSVSRTSLVSSAYRRTSARTVWAYEAADAPLNTGLTRSGEVTGSACVRLVISFLSRVRHVAAVECYERHHPTSYPVLMRAHVLVRGLLGGILFGLVMAAGACSFVRQDELRARAASDLACAPDNLVTRCIVGTNGSWMVTGCGRYARYAKTSHGPRLEGIGVGRPPEEEWLCARSF